jgi:hypothetical protein
MMRNKLVRGRPWTSAARLAAGGLLVVGVSGTVGCLDRPIAPNEPRTTTTIVERLTQSAVDKIDLVLAIDNSRSMADKQEILALAVPDLVRGLVNPRCIDPSGVQAPTTPASSTEDCPAGLEREFEPVKDIHIGIISSSLGGHGADACQVTNLDSASNDDKGHLLARTDPGASGTPVETYQGKGYLAWDPTQKLVGEVGVPDQGDGEADLDVDTTADLNNTNLLKQLTDMVIGAGQIGCGYEAQLESWYRFLIDPEPYDKIAVQGGNAVPEGIDEVLKTQRIDFLRPDSLLAIIVLTDENDCSIRESGQFFYAAQQNNPNQTKFHLPRPRTECATNPNDECCRSCGQNADGCPNDDANCKNPDGTVKALSETEDAINLRCYEQKRRFGIDFLYPIDRYTQGLTDLNVPNRAGELVPNPIFTDLNPDDDNSNIRDAGLVFFAGIVGVPWQDIARQNAAGDPDLLGGLDAEGEAVGGFKNADELGLPNGPEPTTWDIILGDPTNYVPAKDPHMIESIDPRTGSNPITGDTIAPPASPNGTNTINGHEWTINNRGDLQYACIFDLLPGSERDCSVAGALSCDCDVGNDNPLCEPDPANNNERTLQTRAKAYPGLRELQVIRSLGAQGIVGSVCPAQVTAPNQPDFGYRPAIGAIIDRLKTALGGQCLPRTLTPDDDGQVSCLVLEARKTDGNCKCDYAARSDVTGDHEPAAQAALDLPISKISKLDCVCEINQTLGDDNTIVGDDALTACQNNITEPVLLSAGPNSGAPVDGWCYVDATTTPPTGNPDIVAKCADTERRIVRFVGKGEAQAGATLFITCSGE